jgi:hypothetical protein
VRGEFAFLEAKHFGLSPFDQAVMVPSDGSRVMIRRGNAILQKNVGLLELRTWDKTCHGNGVNTGLFGYRPTNPSWPLPVDQTTGGRYRHGEWEYEIVVTPLSDGSTMKRVELLKWPGSPKWVLPQSTKIVTPWGLLER